MSFSTFRRWSLSIVRASEHWSFCTSDSFRRDTGLRSLASEASHCSFSPICTSFLFFASRPNESEGTARLAWQTTESAAVHFSCIYLSRQSCAMRENARGEAALARPGLLVLPPREVLRSFLKLTPAMCWRPAIFADHERPVVLGGRSQLARKPALHSLFQYSKRKVWVFRKLL